jgi:hypothetical protein
MKNIKFCCLNCGNSLKNNLDSLNCIECNKNYPIENGIYSFIESPHYYTDLNKQDMIQLIQDSKENGWKNAIYNRFHDKNPFLYNIILDETRADWQYMLPLNLDSVALDIGAGWGTISMPLARNIGHIVSLDGTKDRLEFLKVRANQENLDNITVVHSNIFTHPFGSQQFDLVVFNGVLEWVGVGQGDSIDPKEKQLQALKIANDLLKDGGYLYIGIENSHGFKYILGEPDDHTGLKYATYLDRQDANEISMKKLNTNYQTYTYSQCGYKDLLEDSGFSIMDFYYPVPDYKRIEYIYKLDNTNVAEFLLNQLRFTHPSSTIKERVLDLELVSNQFNGLANFPASYSIFAKKGGPSK